MHKPLLFLLPAIALLAVAGCQKSGSDVPAAVATQYRGQLLTESAPADAKSVADVRAQLAASSKPEAPQEIVMTGTIGQMPNPFQQGNEHPNFPWVESAASFFLVDDATVEEFAKHGHAKGEECSFCLGMAGRRTDRVALVEIRQEDGKPVPYRADGLLGLKEGDHLVIEGRAILIMGTMLVVTPSSMYVGPAAQPPATSSESPDTKPEQAAASAE